MSLLSSSLVDTKRFCFVSELAGHMKEVTNQSRSVVDDSIYPITLGLDGGTQDVLMMCNLNCYFSPKCSLYPLLVNHKGHIQRPRKLQK